MLEEPEFVLTVQQDPVSCSLNHPVTYFQGKTGSFLKPNLIQKCFLVLWTFPFYSAAKNL